MALSCIVVSAGGCLTIVWVFAIVSFFMGLGHYVGEETSVDVIGYVAKQASASREREIWRPSPRNEEGEGREGCIRVQSVCQWIV